MKRVILIDDEPAFTSGVKLNLEQMGDYEVSIVNDSSEAMDRVRSLRPDIILLDIIMPGVEGGRILKELEGDPELRKIPVIVVTAMISHRTPGDAGIVDYAGVMMLAKPVTTETLIQCIEKKLANAN